MKFSEWTSVSEYLVKNLEDLILNSGEYQVGDQFLTESAICEKYHVGRSSVREALRILAATGYIKSLRGKGTYIASVNTTQDQFQLRKIYVANQKKFDKIVETRLYIEPPAVFQVAKNIIPSDMEMLSHMCDEFTDAVAKHDITRVIALDEKFHIAIVDIIDNEYISFFNREIQKKASEFRAKTFMVESFFPIAEKEHNQLLAAIAEGNAALAEREMRGHILHIKEYYANYNRAEEETSS